MENKTPDTQNNQVMPNGWKDVTIVPDMPLTALINFFNVLNQRLAALEDIVTVQGPDGKPISITDLYALQAAEAMKAQTEAEAESERQGE